jgi:hypothetical protein
VPTHRKGAESSAVASASIRHVSAVGDLEPGRRLGAGGGLKAATPPAAGRRSSRAPGGSGLGEPHERRARCVNACSRAQPRACMHWCPLFCLPLRLASLSTCAPLPPVLPQNRPGSRAISGVGLTRCPGGCGGGPPGSLQLRHATSLRFSQGDVVGSPSDAPGRPVHWGGPTACGWRGGGRCAAAPPRRCRPSHQPNG